MKRDKPRKNKKSSAFRFAVCLLGFAAVLIVPHLASAQDTRSLKGGCGLRTERALS